jgi:tetratricopeptide (TPR) repeat protein
MIRVSLLVVLALGVCAVSGAPSTLNPQPPPSPLDELAIAALWSATDVLWHRGEHSRVIEVMEAIVAIDSNQLEAYTESAWLLWSQGREQEAVSMYTRATQALPDNFETWFEFGIYYRHHIKNNEKAKELFLKAIACNPHPNAVERELAHTYEDLGQITDSYRLWQSLLEQYPEDDVIRLNYDRFLQKHGL